MRVVFDTNVVVSALLWGGLPRKAFDAVENEQAILISSEPLVAELELVLSRQKFAERLAQLGQTSESLLERYKFIIEMVEPAEIGRVVPNDPKDDKFIACAVGGTAILVVSGDHHLLTLGMYQDIEIITVQQFLERVSL